MIYINDNRCECSHRKSEHILIKGVSGPCSLNQKACDCWAYKYHYQLHDNQIAIEIVHNNNGGYFI